MKNSELLLFFFIIYSVIITFVFIAIIYKVIKKYRELDKYNEELFLEIAKWRQKCYSKDKEE